MIEKLKLYVQDNVELAKLEGIEAAGKMAGKVVWMVGLLLFGFFFLMLLSFAIGFYISSIYDYTTGFFVVTGIYLLLIILLLVFKKQIVTTVLNKTFAATTND